VSATGWISPCHAFEPTASVHEHDNAFSRPLPEVLQKSPRLVVCREAQSVRGGCDAGCIARAVLINAA
jgi:hypothetical protein